MGWRKGEGREAVGGGVESRRGDALHKMPYGYDRLIIVYLCTVLQNRLGLLDQASWNLVTHFYSDFILMIGPVLMDPDFWSTAG